MAYIIITYARHKSNYGVKCCILKCCSTINNNNNVRTIYAATGVRLQMYKLINTIITCTCSIIPLNICKRCRLALGTCKSVSFDEIATTAQIEIGRSSQCDRLG